MKTEKELDNLFKQGLEEPGNYKDYREEDWDALETLLDKEKKRGIVFWLPLLSSVAALLLLAMGWFFVKPAINKNNNRQIVNVAKHNSSDEGKMALTAQKPKLTNSDQDNPGKDDRLIQQHAVLIKKLRLPANGKTSVGGINNKSFLTLSAVEAGRTAGLSNDNNTFGEPGEVLAAIDNKVFPEGELSSPVAFNMLNITSGSPLKPDSKKVKSLSGFHPQYALTVLASSNINGVGSFADSKVGSTGGFLFSVGLTKKFTISTGAAYAKTPYSTDFYNYHTTYPFKTNPETVTADCRVLDIPLNIDYQLTSKGRNKFSVGSGLSTYIMLSENYHYNYANPNPYALTDVSFVNKNRHFLGVLNLDATYQRQLNSKLSLALQPYLKLPLTDIGNGQVKLQSTGVSVGLSWNINTLKR
jgi:hypothetical protein